jgi:hypothetical protein
LKEAVVVLEKKKDVVVDRTCSYFLRWDGIKIVL